MCSRIPKEYKLNQLMTAESGAETARRLLVERRGWLVLYGEPGQPFTTALLTEAETADEAKRKGMGAYGAHPILLVWKFEDSHRNRFAPQGVTEHGTFVSFSTRQLTMGELQQIYNAGTPTDTAHLVGASRPKDGRHPSEVGTKLAAWRAPVPATSHESQPTA